MSMPAVSAGEGLIHDLGAALLKNDDCQPVVIGDFDSLDKSEMLHPEGKHRFNFFHKKDRSEFLDRHFEPRDHSAMNLPKALFIAEET